jgi:hypothetical protein
MVAGERRLPAASRTGETVMGASSQSHSGQSPLPYQRSRNPQAQSPANTAYSLRRSDAGASGSSTTRPMLVLCERLGLDERDACLHPWSGSLRPPARGTAHERVELHSPGGYPCERCRCGGGAVYRSSSSGGGALEDELQPVDVIDLLSDLAEAKRANERQSGARGRRLTDARQTRARRRASACRRSARPRTPPAQVARAVL